LHFPLIKLSAAAQSPHNSQERSMFKKVLSLSVLACLAGAVSPLFGQFDQVYLAKGAPNKGAITATTKDAVTMDMAGVARPFQVNEITRVTFADEPAELNNARNAVSQQNFNLAMQELKKLDGQTFDRSLIAADVEFYKALCQARLAMSEGGDKAAATTAMLGWAGKNQGNHHFYESAEILGDLASASGKFADAARYYNGLAAAPWGDYQMRANIAIGRSLSAQKDFAGALQKYDAVLQSQLATPEAAQQKLLASVGKAVCLAETGKPDEGVTMLTDIIAKNDPQETVLFARTYNALGNCYLKSNKPKDALQAFLHTDILFYADAESHAEALYRLSKLWNDVNKADRAVAARNTLRERYSGSIWATLE
jgi:tetratricopeptide (TPR) repeat protein